MQSLGLIKWFDNEKGFGKIGTVTGDDIFLHANQFISKPEKVLKCKAVFFDIQEDKKGKNAINVSDPETYEHFKYILSLKEIDPKINIEFTLKGKSKWGKEYIRKEYRDTSVFGYAIYQLLRHKNPDTVKGFFIKYSDESDFDTLETIKKRFEITRDVLNKLEFKTANADGDNVVDEVKSETSSSVIIEIFRYYLSKTEAKYLFDIWRQSYYHPIIQSNTFLHKIFAKEFNFPDTIFLENYKNIDSHLIFKLLKNNEREDICVSIIYKKIEDYSEVIESIYAEIKSCISELAETESYSELIDSLFKKNINNFLKEKEKLHDSDYFNRFLSSLSRNSVGKQKEQAIEIINQSIGDELVFKYWQEFRYFKPSNDFIHKHLDKLSRNDFINAPSEFQSEYFLAQYGKLNFDNTLLPFCNLLFLVLEIHSCQIEKIVNELFDKYKVAIWLYYSYFDKNKDYLFLNRNSKFNINFSKDNFIKCIYGIDDIHEIIQLVKIINEINLVYKNHKTNSNDEASINKFSDQDKFKTIDVIIKKIDYSLELSVLDILKYNLTEQDHELNIKIAKYFIPKFLNPDNDGDFKILLTFEKYFENDKKNKNDFYYHINDFVSTPKKITLWYNDYINEIDINTAIIFLNESPQDIQFEILKKIFSSIHLNKKLITTELYNQFENLANNPSLNLNVRIALYVVNTLKSNHQFITDKTIFELVSQRLNENVGELVKIDELFDSCGGRVWKTYAYSPDDKVNWYININGNDFFVENNFAYIDGKSYSFDKERRIININGVTYNFKWVKKENLFHTENYGVPDGLTFCDAVKSQLDEDLNSNFYWCCNSKCYSPCQRDYNPFQWKKYTLRDFIKILAIPFDNDLYYRFVSVVNRVNRLLEKLKCNSCEKLMRDAKTSEFAFYRVNTFHCTNPDCGEYHKSVYLTHCLNWRCLNIIDTRISKACPNGWYICDKCDNCCTQEKIDMRYQNLLTNAAFNSNNPRHQKLKFQVDNKLGHLENNEIYNFRNGEKK